MLVCACTGAPSVNEGSGRDVVVCFFPEFLYLSLIVRLSLLWRVRNQVHPHMCTGLVFVGRALVLIRVSLCRVRNQAQWASTPHVGTAGFWSCAACESVVIMLRRNT